MALVMSIAYREYSVHQALALALANRAYKADSIYDLLVLI